jgi:hypothetical protein
MWGTWIQCRVGDRARFREIGLATPSAPSELAIERPERERRCASGCGGAGRLLAFHSVG